MIGKKSDEKFAMSILTQPVLLKIVKPLLNSYHGRDDLN
jgi:hypothetical protein